MYFKFLIGVRLISEGHKKVAEGWLELEQLMEETEAGNLPALLRGMETSLRMGTPTPTSTPTSTPTLEQMQASAAAMGLGVVKKEGDDKPVTICVSKAPYKYNYGCPRCDVPPTVSKNGMDAHIREFHTRQPLLCAYCKFTTFNQDSLGRHERQDCPALKMKF